MNQSSQPGDKGTQPESDKPKTTLPSRLRLAGRHYAAAAKEKYEVASQYRRKALKTIWRWLTTSLKWIDTHNGLLTAAATIAIAVLTYYVAQFTSEQGKITNRQLAVMEADQRPWLKVEVFPGDLQSFLPSENNPFPTLLFGPHVKVTNVGKSPAFNAQLHFLGYPISKDHSDPHLGQKESCERIRSAPLDSPGRGHVLFPGDSFDEGMGTGGYNVAFMGPKWRRQYLTEEKDGSLSIVFYVIGCADYVFGEPLRHHQTGFVYEVYRTIVRNGTNTFDNRFFIGQNVSRDAIKLVPSQSSPLAD